MTFLSTKEWKEREKAHATRVSLIADAFLQRRAIGQKHPVHDFLFTYYNFSPTKLKQWVPRFDPALEMSPNEADMQRFNAYWFVQNENTFQLNPERLQGQALGLVEFVENLCCEILKRPPRFGCFGLHEWAMVYRLSLEELRHTDYPLRLAPEALAEFVESQNLCCTHYDAYRFFTPPAQPLNLFKPTLDTRPQNEQAGCLHANMDLYKWATKLWPWIGSDFIAETFLLALEGRELDMRASPYDLIKEGYEPIKIETEEGRKHYQFLQQQYTQKTQTLRCNLAHFCGQLRAWQEKNKVR